jgi:malonyl-CoA decarboxylase
MEVMRGNAPVTLSPNGVKGQVRNLASSVSSLFDAMVARMRRVGGNRGDTGSGSLTAKQASVEQLQQIARKILSAQAHASGTALAASFIDVYAALNSEHRRDALLMLACDFGANHELLAQSCKAFLDNPNDESYRAIANCVEPPRQELFRRLNQAPYATLALVRLREELLRLLPTDPQLKAVDDDLFHLFHSWFNRGFLIMQRIDWNSPAQLLDKIIGYEAVHSIGSWDELRRRLAPEDRRCYAFFHPALLDEPLIFVEIALSNKIEGSINSILREDRQPIASDTADTAMFYSISNCQAGLQGISFGHHLLQQVVEDLSRELPGLKRFVTLSPVPGFVHWLREQQAKGDTEAEALLAGPATDAPPPGDAILGPALRYLTEAKDRNGRPRDPVMRFHLGNGARLEHLCLGGDLSSAGMAKSLGLMVNYRYELSALEANRTRFLEGEVPLGDPVQQLKREKSAQQIIKNDKNDR